MERIRVEFVVVVVMSVVWAITSASVDVVYSQSPPSLPVIFRGNVTLNGSPVVDGLNVTAVDNGLVVGSALTSGGMYSLTACGESMADV